MLAPLTGVWDHSLFLSAGNRFAMHPEQDIFVRTDNYDQRLLTCFMLTPQSERTCPGTLTLPPDGTPRYSTGESRCDRGHRGTG